MVEDVVRHFVAIFWIRTSSLSQNWPFIQAFSPASSFISFLICKHLWIIICKHRTWGCGGPGVLSNYHQYLTSILKWTIVEPTEISISICRWIWCAHFENTGRRHRMNSRRRHGKARISSYADAPGYRRPRMKTLSRILFTPNNSVCSLFFQNTLLFCLNFSSILFITGFEIFQQEGNITTLQ